ncbi:MAG: anion permease [Flavonifractor plautii]
MPTSESHALVAGLTGAALALPGGLDNIRAGAWGRVLLGLVLSVALGWWVGGLCRRLLERLHPSSPLPPGPTGRGGRYGLPPRGPGRAEISGRLSPGRRAGPGGGVGQTFSVPGWLMLLCAAVMALGTAMGGRRIIETVGRDMVILAPREGLAADLGGGLCLLLCTLAGLPVSTTHAKTAAILGAGSAGGGTVNHRVAARIALTWLFTFPGCGLLGFLLASLFRSPLSCGILMPGTIF